MKVVIHGGMFKTGTTSLQQALNVRRNELELEGIVYPVTEIGQHSMILNVRNPLWDADLLHNMALSADDKHASMLLLSGEAVSALSQSQFNRLTACFDGWPVEYVFCFRHWSSYLPSRWIQNCLRRDSQTFEEYLLNAVDPALNHFDARFDLILTRAAESGAAAVRAVSWDLAVAQQQSANFEVLKAIGLEDRIARMIAMQNPWLNARPEIMNVELLRVLNGITAHSLGLPQDELFRVYADHLECSRFFDYFKILDLLPDNLKQQILGNLKDFGPKTVNLPVFPMLEKFLADKHYGKFTNIAGSSIFGITTQKEHTFVSYPVKWKEIYSNIDAELVNALIDIFLKHLLTLP